MPARPLPEFAVERWFNLAGTAAPSMAGRVVAIEAFQMLCPGCVSHGLPQAMRLVSAFGPELLVLGLHTVFEHHEAMTPVALEAFLYEYRISFPVGVDRHEPDDPMPVTMRRFGLQGTPSLLLVDRGGRLRFQGLGAVEDLRLGALVGRLLDEPAPSVD
ncbi:MAG: TlpA family protein disulfide reductase [Actinomycetales bacterium]